LAAIPKSPSYFSAYSPYFDQKSFLIRQHYVLDQMAAQGKITKKQADEAKKVDVLAQVQPQETKYAGIKAPYFVLAARDELNKKRAGSAAKVGGWKVITTLDMNLQNKAEEAAQNNVANLRRAGGDEEAIVVEDTKTGQMKALVGGVDFNDPDHGQFNYAHQAYISPGSSFKPYDYVTLLDNHTDAGAGSVLYDTQGPLPGYPCTIKGTSKESNCLHDYDFKSPGPMTLRYALGGSRNIPAVKSMLEAVPNDTSPNRINSINKVITTANSLMAAPNAYRCFKDGVDINQAKTTDETQCYGASAIGDGAYLHLDQHINGVASLARLGNSIPNTYISKVINASDKTIFTFKQPKGTQVVRPEAAYIVNDMASDPQASYLNNSQKWQHYKGWNTAVKTGTTNDGYDGLMMSWNTQYAVGSWVGYHTRNKSLNAAGMEFITLPLTRTVMQYALDSLHTNPVNWTPPQGIQTQSSFKSITAYSTQGPSPTTDIYPSWYKQRATSSKQVTIDRVSNKVATNCTPDSAKQNTGGNAAPNAYSIDIFYPPGNNASTNSQTIDTSAQDDVHKCSDSPPTINLTATGNNDGTYTITAFVSAGTHPLNDSNYSQFPGTVTFSINGTTVKTSSVSDPQDNITFEYTPSSSGTMTATVTDSVLYSASATADIAFAQASSLSFKSAKAGGGNTTVKWEGGTGTVTVSGGSGCSAPASAGSCVINSGAPKNSTVTLSDSAGGSASGKVD
jgi:penicillin-binding protein 1A